jgi:general secretion pathway protein G
MKRALILILWAVLGFFFLVVCMALFSSPSTSSKHTLVQSDIQAISSALESYRQTTGDYPTTDQGLMALVTRPETLPEERDWQAIATKVPTDPWKNEYRYRRLPDSSPRPFELRCVGPDGVAGNEDDRVSE